MTEPASRTPDTRKLRLCALLGVIGGVVNAVSDVLLRYGPVAGDEITHEFMATMPFTQTFVGALLGGVVGIPMWAFILVPLYEGLAPAGRRQAWALVVLFAHLFVVSAIYHTVYALYAAVFATLGHTEAANAPAALAHLEQRLVLFDNVLRTVWLVVGAVASLWFAIVALSRRTRFPRWAAAVTPIMAIPAVIVAERLPAPLGGYIRPWIGTGVFTLFFVMVAWTMWRRINDTQTATS